MASTYTIDKAHNTWSKAHRPAVTIDPGDIVIFDTPEITKGQLSATSTVADIGTLDFAPIHQICGPVAVRGAEPGDTLVVEILDIKPKSWAWSAIIPGFSLLADDEAFKTPYLHIWDLTPGDHAVFKPGIVIPFEPFCGVMGVAPAEDGELNTIPPRRNGGNLDIKQLVAGSVAFFPVLAPGALFSCGDVHAAQGDGEVCGTGLECEATVTLRFGLQKGREIPELEFRMPSRMTGSWNAAGWHCVTRHGPDLMENTKNAIRGMIAYLGREHGLSPQEAFVLCSACVDVKISEVVDAPNWIVTAALPLGIFQS
jgi:acetamidase/formamidase